VLSGAIFFVFLFSITLTNPIEKLVEVTRKVAAGNFDVHADIHSHDEVGELAGSFDAMVDGLKERDKIKNVMNKFHGSAITEDLMKGDDLSLGGVNKEVTVFFSDIRDFTKFSEGHTPEEVVGMLNEYFEIMVGIVTKNHGVVDKFVGDAMMAVWGAPKATGQDEYYAIKACLEMRQALEELNKLRIARNQVEIKIGMGLHSGPAISGTIGSSERMEYTVIGDTVNTASRIESSTKAFGTDLLISGETLARTEGKFIFEYAGAAEVKGKAEPLKMNKVKGYIDENGQEVLVKTKYSDYEAGNADKVKIAS
jgi:adenylate cyclase